MTSLINEGFRSALPWLNGNLQTVAYKVRPRNYPIDDLSTEERLLVDIGDGTGDALAVRINRPIAGVEPGRPIVLLVHGMGATIDTHYIWATAQGLLRAGYPVARVDLRGVGDSTEHSTSMYHGGRTSDLRAVVRALGHERGTQGVVQVGFSLGGNATLKMLGEGTDELPLRAGVSVCAPLELAATVEHMGGRLFGLYERHLVTRLKENLRDSGLPFTDAELSGMSDVRSIVDFDNLVTAPRNGWHDAAEYYEHNSSAQYLRTITVPALVIHAIDDPMIPAGSYRAIDWDDLAANTPVRHAFTANGGHVGFHEHGAELPWYVGRILRFLDSV